MGIIVNGMRSVWWFTVYLRYYAESGKVTLLFRESKSAFFECEWGSVLPFISLILVQRAQSYNGLRQTDFLPFRAVTPSWLAKFYVYAAVYDISVAFSWMMVVVVMLAEGLLLAEAGCFAW